MMRESLEKYQSYPKRDGWNDRCIALSPGIINGWTEGWNWNQVKSEGYKYK